MADNKYKGNSSAYGYGHLLKEMDFGGFINSNPNSGKKEPWDQWTDKYKAKYELPTNTSWQNESNYLRKGTIGNAPSPTQNPNGGIIGNNASQLSQTALTGAKTSQAPIIPNLGASLGNPVSNTSGADFGSVTTSVGQVSPPRAMQVPMDQRKRYEYNAPNTDTGSGGTYSLPEVSVTGEKSWYGGLPNTEGQQTAEKMQIGASKNWSQNMASTQYDQQMERKAAKTKQAQIDRIDNIWDPGLPTTEGYGNNLKPAGMVGNPKNTWEKQVLHEDNYKDSGRRWTNEQVSENLATDKKNKMDAWKGVVENEYGVPTEGSSSGISSDREMHLQAVKGPDTSKAAYQDKRTADDWFKQSGIDMDIGDDPLSIGKEVTGGLTPDSMVDSIATAEPLKVGSKLGAGLDKFNTTVKGAGKVLEKAAPAISALTTIGTGVSEMKQRKKTIGKLQDSISELSGTIGNLANEESAEEDSMFDEFSEGNRRIGTARNLQLGSALDAVKGSNLNTGSIKKIKKDITDDMGTSTDLDLASAFDSYEQKRDEYTTESRENRSTMNAQLKQLQEQLKEEQKDQKMAPWSMAADLAIGAISVANPLVGIGLGAVKNRAMG
tara:strand:+ start:440 stop:2254 length:1815 start_codon:yes stop_codon:yes gene_type:complete